MAKPATSATPAAAAHSNKPWLRLVRLEWRFALGAAVGALAAWLAPTSMGTLARAVAAWDGFAAVNLFLILAAMRTADTDDIRRVAASSDLPRTVAFLVVIGAALASLVAVVGLLGTLKDVPKAAKALHLALGLGAVALAWTLVHCVFTLRYAHTYYDADEQGHDQGGL
jgi:uncharacterized membrane protein